MYVMFAVVFFRYGRGKVLYSLLGQVSYGHLQAQTRCVHVGVGGCGYMHACVYVFVYMQCHAMYVLCYVHMYVLVLALHYGIKNIK